jgi:hypothetical protein
LRLLLFPQAHHHIIDSVLVQPGLVTPLRFLARRGIAVEEGPKSLRFGVLVLYSKFEIAYIHVLVEVRLVVVD